MDAPIDGASPAAFRILFGLLMAFAMIRFLARGWVEELYLQPTFFFSYEFFPWVRPLPALAMHGLFVLLAGLALAVALGWCYRPAIALFFVGFTYVELIDKTTYLNHYYLVSLLSGLMIFLPCHRVWSLDAARRGWTTNPVVPGWVLGLLRFQFGVVYVFAGLAKLTPDWLFAAQPLRTWLAARSELPLVGPLLDEVPVAYAASWFGALFDLAIVPLLLHRRTRPGAFAFVVTFHVATWLLFRIGIFPWLMIIGATLFFSPDWPRRFLAWSPGFSRSGVPVGQGANCFERSKLSCDWPAEAGTPCTPTWTWHVISLYLAVQIALPLRSYFQAEPSSWTNRAFNWSWRVMLVEKTGWVEFHAMDPASGQPRRIRATDYLSPRQAQFMAQDPEMIRAFARHIAAELRRQSGHDVQVYADAFASLNGRPAQRLINPSVDLASSTRADWIVPLNSASDIDCRLSR